MIFTSRLFSLLGGWQIVNRRWSQIRLRMFRDFAVLSRRAFFREGPVVDSLWLTHFEDGQSPLDSSSSILRASFPTIYRLWKIRVTWSMSMHVPGFLLPGFSNPWCPVVTMAQDAQRICVATSRSRCAKGCWRYYDGQNDWLSYGKMVIFHGKLVFLVESRRWALGFWCEFWCES